MYNLQSAVTKYFRLVFLISLITLCGAFTASAADVTLTWDANTESDIVGYKLFYGTSSGNYAVTVDVGHSSTFTITDLEGGMTYYFAATAYDTSYPDGHHVLTSTSFFKPIQLQHQPGQTEVFLLRIR